jgi:hypothetical protein
VFLNHAPRLSSANLSPKLRVASAQHVILPELRANTKVTVSDENWLYNKMGGVVDETRP